MTNMTKYLLQHAYKMQENFLNFKILQPATTKNNINNNENNLLKNIEKNKC